ncbi:MAG: Ubiquitin carboxyl-terminal hydrolase [Chlamydiia bacterium]|nr:Ubiquitin carboxyl-terminal hydrolase [Chlamydiia bacterium]
MSFKISPHPSESSTPPLPPRKKPPELGLGEKIWKALQNCAEAIQSVIHRISTTIQDCFSAKSKKSPDLKTKTIQKLQPNDQSKVQIATRVMIPSLEEEDEIIKKFQAIKPIAAPSTKPSATKEKPVIDSLQLGMGVQNYDQSCYVTSVIQALRVSGFRDLPPPEKDPRSMTEVEKQQEAQSLLLRNELFRLLDTMEGKNGHIKRTITNDEINNFRKLVISLGFEPRRESRETSQEDAAEFFSFLMTQLGMPPVQYVNQIKHELKATIPQLKSSQDNSPYLRVGFKKAAKLEDLLFNQQVMHSVQLQNIHPEGDGETLFNPETKEKIPFSALNRTVYQQNRATIDVKATESYQLPGDCAPPPILPIGLNRFNNWSQKLKNQIAIAEELDFPIAGKPSVRAHYELSAIVVHDGHFSFSGHYFTYAPKIIEGRKVWVEYNNDQVRIHKEPSKQESASLFSFLLPDTPYETASKNGYLFFYKFTGYTSAKK